METAPGTRGAYPQMKGCVKMEKLKICGGSRLSGTLRVHGAKNAALPILAASLLPGECVLHNCPRLTDVEAASSPSLGPAPIVRGNRWWCLAAGTVAAVSRMS